MNILGTYLSLYINEYELSSKTRLLLADVISNDVLKCSSLRLRPYLLLTLLLYDIERFRFELISFLSKFIEEIASGVVLLSLGTCKSREIGKNDIKADTIHVRAMAIGTVFRVIHLVY